MGPVQEKKNPPKTSSWEEQSTKEIVELEGVSQHTFIWKLKIIGQLQRGHAITLYCLNKFKNKRRIESLRIRENNDRIACKVDKEQNKTSTNEESSHWN